MKRILVYLTEEEYEWIYKYKPELQSRSEYVRGLFFVGLEVKKNEIEANKSTRSKPNKKRPR